MPIAEAVQSMDLHYSCTSSLNYFNDRKIPYGIYIMIKGIIFSTNYFNNKKLTALIAVSYNFMYIYP